VSQSRPINIPARSRNAVRLLTTWPDDAFERFATTLREAQNRSMNDMIDAIEPLLEGTGVDTNELMGSLGGIEAVRQRRGWSVEDAAEAASRGDGSGAETDEERQILRRRLDVLLADGGVGRAAREFTAVSRSHNLYLSATLETDLRAVFADSPPEDDEPVIGGVILHALRLRYSGNDGPEDFYITLEEADVDRLSRVLDSARASAASVRRVASDAGLVLSEPEGNDD
jgi:hypothetical protein